MITFLADPKWFRVIEFSDNPTSSEEIVDPVKTAISCNIAFLRSPYPGDFTAATLIAPLIVFTTRVERASPLTSSAMISSGFPDFATASNTGTKSWIEVINLSVKRIYGLSSSTVCLSELVIKYGEINPLSNCIPSVVSKKSSKPFPFSTVTTPSSPTF